MFFRFKDWKFNELFNKIDIRSNKKLMPVYFHVGVLVFGFLFKISGNDFLIRIGVILIPIVSYFFFSGKVIENGNDIKLFIYDCGIMCSTGNRKINEQIIDIVSGGRHHFMKFFDFISDKKIEIPFKQHQELENICSICEEQASTSEVLTKFIRKTIDLNLLNNKNFINILTSIAICFIWSFILPPPLGFNSLLTSCKFKAIVSI